VLTVATQAERRAGTRDSIITSARSLFAEFGYGHVSVSDILATAHLSKGAMYHHFSSKEDLFAAVFLRTSTDAIRQSVAAVPSNAAPKDALVAGCLSWLTIATRPEFAKVLLTDGPTVLGWERCRSLEEATSLGVMRTSVQAGVDSGEIRAVSVDLTAKLLNAILSETALELSNRNCTTHEDAVATITSFIEGLSRTP
jgi:AcrR family transcriptional regulator